MNPSTLVVGHRAEKLAAAFLELLGMQVLECNVRLGGGEIDIVARQGADWVFVEVRSRMSDDGISPLDSIGWRKRRQLRHLVAEYLDRDDIDPDSRFRVDVVGITLDRTTAHISHIPDAL